MEKGQERVALGYYLWGKGCRFRLRRRPPRLLSKPFGVESAGWHTAVLQRLGLHLQTQVWTSALSGQTFLSPSCYTFSQLENWNDSTSLFTQLWGGLSELTYANCLAHCQVLEKVISFLILFSGVWVSSKALRPSTLSLLLTPISMPQSSPPRMWPGSAGLKGSDFVGELPPKRSLRMDHSCQTWVHHPAKVRGWGQN